eukprot:NODE_3368_length_795_cov_284.372973.p1 GENE.NODE_3368_length_795_cov_284.372973~~NODE_3368_length_795_cov_284.372973.p1  ORF type:complete len:184 (-),score=50.89 NODE_3368_length_795_cov_284.372973:227-721(-)
MVDCSVATIYNGMRTDIGSTIALVTASDANWYQRVVFDLTFFMIITTMLMNIISGVIIDTFGMLRDSGAERAVYMSQRTFIASLERGEVNKEARKRGTTGSGYHYIQDERHRVWNYMNFIFYLKSKDETDFVGPETRMKRAIDNEDVTWLPIGTCALYQQPVSD